MSPSGILYGTGIWVQDSFPNWRRALWDKGIGLYVHVQWNGVSYIMTQQAYNEWRAARAGNPDAAGNAQNPYTPTPGSDEKWMHPSNVPGSGWTGGATNAPGLYPNSMALVFVAVAAGLLLLK